MDILNKVKFKSEAHVDQGNELQNEVASISSNNEEFKKTNLTQTDDNEMDNKIEIKEAPWWLAESSAEMKCKRDTSASDAYLQVVVQESGENHVIQHDAKEMDTKIEMKEEPIYLDVLTKVKSEYEDSVVQYTSLQNEVASVSADSEEFKKNNVIQKDGNEMDITIEIKEEPWWIGITSAEMNSERETSTSDADQQSVVQDNVLCTTGVSPIETSRLYVEETSSNISSFHGGARLEKKNYRINCDNRSKQHQSTHEGKSPYTCGVCEKSFTRASTLKQHHLIHEGKRPYTCGVCEKSFARASTLKQHHLIHEDKKPYTCGVCGNSFTQSSMLKRHQLIHKGKRPYICGVCGNSFTWPSDLKRHQLIHEGKKPFTCDVCSTSFTRSSNLKQHQLIHEDKRPHTCGVCGNSFTEASKLKKHQVIHEGKRPHTCSVCGNTFTWAFNLKRHLLSHEDKRPYTCSVCGNSFRQAAHLKQHERIYHKTQSNISVSH